MVLCVAAMAFTFQFESALVTVALPDMAHELSVSASSVSLVLLSYLVGAVITFIPAGKLGDRYGLRTVCLAGCLLAVAGTILCGISHSIVSLVFGRLVQGIGAGAFVATGYAMIPTWVGQARIGWGYGMQSLGAGVGMIAGVPAGGLLSNFLAWQWIFYASTPLFIGLFIVAWSVLPGARQQDLMRGVTIQWGVVSAFAALMVGITFILTAGPVFGWADPLLLLAAAGVFLLMVILWFGSRRGHRLFPQELFNSKSSTPALAAMFMVAALTGGVRFLLPFYLEIECGLSILMSSYLLLVYPAFYAPVSLVAGRFSDWLGSRSVVQIATVVLTVSLAGFGALQSRAGAGGAALFMAAFGSATGLFFAPANRLIMTPIPKPYRGEAGGLLSVVFNFGTLAGVALFQLVLTWTSAGGDVPEMSRATGVYDNSLFFGPCLALGSLLGMLAALCIYRIEPEAPSVRRGQE